MTDKPTPQPPAKAPCGHLAKHLKYDKATRTINCELCLNPTVGLTITEEDAQMDKPTPKPEPTDADRERAERLYRDDYDGKQSTFLEVVAAELAAVREEVLFNIIRNLSDAGSRCHQYKSVGCWGGKCSCGKEWDDEGLENYVEHLSV